MRFLHLVVVAALVVAASYVYKIKFDSTVQAERVAKLRSEIRHEHDNIAALRAEWAQLDNPIRIQTLAQRHLAIRPIDPTQIDSLDHLPVRPSGPGIVAPADAVATFMDEAEPDFATGSIAALPASGTIETAPIAHARVEATSAETKLGRPR